MFVFIFRSVEQPWPIRHTPKDDNAYARAENARDVQMAASAQTRLPMALPEEEAPARRARRSAFLEGFSLHADTHVHQNDRKGLERLCRYGARGPVTLERLSRREDGKLVYRLKKAAAGATQLVLTPLQWVKRLSALVVKPKVHLTRFFGVLAPNAKLRARVVPRVPSPTPVLEQTTAAPNTSRPPPRPRLCWAELLRRTFELDVLRCPCGGRRRVIALVTSSSVCRKILQHLGRPDAPVEFPKAAGPPQLALAF